MKIYLIQFQRKNGENNGTPYLTASQRVAEATIVNCRKQGVKAYVHCYEVKTQNKNYNSFAVAQYYTETEEPF